MVFRKCNPDKGELSLHCNQDEKIQNSCRYCENGICNKYEN